MSFYSHNVCATADLGARGLRVPMNIQWGPPVLMTRQTPEEEQSHTVPVTLALQLVELVKRWHVPAEELLSGVPLSQRTLEDPLERFPVTTMCDLLERARLLTGEPGLGYYLGLQK